MDNKLTEAQTRVRKAIPRCRVLLNNNWQRAGGMAPTPATPGTNTPASATATMGTVAPVSYTKAVTSAVFTCNATS